MSTRYLDKKTHRFFFTDSGGKRRSYVLIFGDEISLVPGDGTGTGDWVRAVYRNRTGKMKKPRLSAQRSLELYFLDVGQGDAAFIVTPGGRKILVDGGLRNRALGFLIWKYRLDRPANSVDLDCLVLSHADLDHLEGLIPILRHPRIRVRQILHNGIALFRGGFNTKLGHKTSDNRLTTLHSRVGELRGMELADTFAAWIRAVRESGAAYGAVHAGARIPDIGDTAVDLEFLGPVVKRENNSLSLPWFRDKARTINGHSVVFRLCYNKVRVLFSGDLNPPGAARLLAHHGPSGFDAHIFKAPHHGSHEFHPPFFRAVRPMITVVSSGDAPDHGHPRASFLGAVGRVGRSRHPLIFSTEIAATFRDFGNGSAAEPADIMADSTLAALDYSTNEANRLARHSFKKILPGMINVRTDGRMIYAARRVQAGYQWESYGPLRPVE